MILETAAADSAATTAGTDALQGVSSHVMFMARGKTGPFRVETQPLSGPEGAIAVRATLYDEGADDRTGARAVTAASYLFRKVG